MPSRLTNIIPQPPEKQKPGLAYLLPPINDAPDHSLPVPGVDSPSNAQSRTLLPISDAALYTMKIDTNTENKPTRRERTEDRAHNLPGSSGGTDAGGALSSMKINGSSPLPHANVDQSPMSKPNPVSISPTVRNISAEFGPLRSVTNLSISDDGTAGNSTTAPQQQWSSAVGRANLGKSGRVIDKLMGDNDMLKKNLDIAKIAAEDAKQAQKVAEARMETMASEYEARLHDAQLDKASLKKRERQVTDLKSQIEGERQRASAAVESERNWRAAMEQMEAESKRKVDEANTYALLLEGRNNTLTNHWKEQGAMMEASFTKLKELFSNMAKDREEDHRKINLLEELCESKDHILESLIAQKQAIETAFQAYKAEQESELHETKIRVVEQGRANEILNAESIRVLGQLKWALTLRTNVREQG